MYRLKNPNVEAHQYQGELISQLPAWVQNYLGFSEMSGQVPVWRDPVGALRVPNGAKFDQCNVGDWVVMSGTKMVAVRKDVFSQLYELVENDGSA